MIDSLINNYIIENHIDKYYPSFQKKLHAQEMIVDIAKKWVGKKVLCICTSNLCRQYFEKAVFEVDGLDVQYIVIEKGDCYVTNTVTIDDAFLAEDYDEIWNISNRGSFFVNNYFREKKLKFFSLYDCFEERELIFEDEWFSLLQHNVGEFTSKNIETLSKWNNYPIVEFLDLKAKYKNSDDLRRKRMYLEKMLFVALYIKDFSATFELLDELIKIDDEYLKIKNALSSILLNVKDMLAARNKDDIFVYWIDKVPYVDFDKLPGIYDLCKTRALNFEQFYTMNPYTIAGFAQMFAGKKPVDDSGCFLSEQGLESSYFIDLLKQKGYRTCFVSSDFERCIDDDNKTTAFHDEFASSSEVIWDCINNLLKSDKPMLVVGQMAIEGHEPNMSIGINRYTNRDERYNECLNYIDKQVCFYDEWMPNSITRIFMSDHGKAAFRSRFHIFLSVVSNKIPPKSDDSMHCLLDYKDLILDIIGGKQNLLEGKSREYVEIQDYNHMSGFDIGVVIKNKRSIEPLIRGYRGIITRKHIYVKFSNGNEWLSINDESVVYPFEPSWYQRKDDLDESVSPEEIQTFRQLVDSCAISEKIVKAREKYNSYVWAIYNKAIDKNLKKVNLINEIFYGFPTTSIAIRFGGYHTLGLLSILTAKNREKIKYIIDRNKNCLCSKYDIPILDKVPCDIEIVVISSKIFSNEIDQYPNGEKHSNVKYINLYEILKNNGISCRFNCFEFEADDDDYEVGYPFEEFWSSVKI